MSDDTLAGLFVSAAQAYPDRVFLRWCAGDERIVWTYAETAVRVEALAARFDELGIGVGDNVVIHTAAMVPSIVFDLACACAGVVFTPIETTSLPAVLDIVGRTAAKAVLTTPDRVGPYDGRPIIADDCRSPVTGDPAVAVTRLAERAGRLDGSSIYMLQPTSGTTGGSKLVIRDHATFERVGRVLTFGTQRASEPPARVLMVPAMTHGMGQYLFAIGIWLGAEFGVTSKIDVAADIEEIRWLDPTHMALTPRVLRSLIQQLGGLANVTRIFGPSAKFLISSGAAPDIELLEAVQRSGVTVIEAFGASEISVVAHTRPGHWKAGLLGHVLDDVKLRVTDEGELLAWTPVLFRGYYGQPELVAKAFTDDGFYRTGDRVALDPDGGFRYLGRVVDTFNLFDGSNVAPGAIEDAISRLPWVEQVILFGDQRPYIVGLLVPHPSLREPTAALRALIQQDIGRICSVLDPNARIRRIAICDPFAAEIYQVVGHGKVRRNRKAALAAFASTVDALYRDGEAGALVEIPGAVERRAASRQAVKWLLRLGESLAYTRDASRSGAYVVLDAPLARAEIRVDVIEADGRGFTIDAVVTRNDGSGVALRWVGPAAALDELRRRLPP